MTGTVYRLLFNKVLVESGFLALAIRGWAYPFVLLGLNLN